MVSLAKQDCHLVSGTLNHQLASLDKNSFLTTILVSQRILLDSNDFTFFLKYKT